MSRSQGLMGQLFASGGLVDHHCHGVIDGALSRDEFELMITESNWSATGGESTFDSQLGFSLRRWCAPVLDLPPSAQPEEYLARRAELGAPEVNRRLLAASGIEHFVVETGFRGDEILGPEQMAERANARSSEVVRLETLAEQLIERSPDSASYPENFRALLATALNTAIGVKTIAAYRIGLDFDPSRPSDSEVREAVEAWLTEISEGTPIRLDSPVLIRFGIWTAVDERAAIQFHVGFGDPDVDLHRCNPLLLSDWLRLTRETGARALLLHCYPFHREAGYLAHSFPHVYMDVGLALNYTGARAREVLGEALELTPFSRMLFSSDAFGLSELYFLGAQLFRDGFSYWAQQWVDRGEWSVADAVRVSDMIARENFLRAYDLPSKAGAQ